MKKTFLNLIFSDEELAILEEINDECIKDYLSKLDSDNPWYDPFAYNEAESDMRDRISVMFAEKDMKFDDRQVEFIANELYHEFI